MTQRLVVPVALAAVGYLAALGIVLRLLGEAIEAAARMERLP